LTNHIFKRGRQDFKYIFVGVNNASQIEADEECHGKAWLQNSSSFFNSFCTKLKPLLCSLLLCNRSKISAIPMNGTNSKPSQVIFS
jgi:hypothetical protein